MDLKTLYTEKIRKSSVVVLCATGAVFFAFAYFIFYAPLIKQIKNRSLECKATEAKLQEARNAAEYARSRKVALPQNDFSGKLVLSGIFLDKAGPQAIINQAIVTTGDRIGGSLVKEIKEDSVVLNDGVKDFELRISE